MLPTLKIGDEIVLSKDKENYNIYDKSATYLVIKGNKHKIKNGIFTKATTISSPPHQPHSAPSHPHKNQAAFGKSLPSPQFALQS